MNSKDAQATAGLLERIGRLLATDAHSSGLAPVQWEVLRYLDRANEFSRSSAALTAYLGSTKGTVSQTIKALEQRGLVTNQPSKQDRRKNRLSLTSRGTKLLLDDPMTAWSRALSALPEAEQQRFHETLEELVRDRLRSQGRQAFGICKDCKFFGRAHEKGAPHYCKLLEVPLAEAASEEICFEQVGR